MPKQAASKFSQVQSVQRFFWVGRRQVGVNQEQGRVFRWVGWAERGWSLDVAFKLQPAPHPWAIWVWFRPCSMFDLASA